MRYYIICLLFLSCTTKDNQFIFNNFYETKENLLRNGFKVSSMFDYANNQDDNIFWLNKNDTIVIYTFDDQAKVGLIEIKFELNKFDTSTIFNALNSYGYRRIKSKNGIGRYAYFNNSNNFTYDVNINQKNISFKRRLKQTSVIIDSANIK